MKSAYTFAITALTLIGAACSDRESTRVPEGQISAKMIRNPRSADGIDPTALKELPVIKFDDTSHNFGMMSSGEIVEHEFTFRNEGKGPLIIAGATSSCGCTVPEFSREPIPPGGSGSLKVTFSSVGKQGYIVKGISVTSNAFPSIQDLTVTADIKP